MDLVADIKQRVLIEDLVGQYVELKRSGRNFKALCPFHTEKSPSFHVSVEKQIAFCFGCQKGGDLFQFYQEVEGVDFPEALKQLAEKAGLDSSLYRAVSARPSLNKDQKKQYYDLHQLALHYFQKHLWESDDGKKVLDYVRARGLTDETIRSWGIGFAPELPDGFFTHAIQTHSDRASLIAFGLVIARDTDSQQVFDRFRMRLMFPIYDTQGHIIAYGGRALKKEMEPKYLNSPETTGYKKSEVLYGLHQAKTAIREKKRIIMVEGYFDVISCHQAGITEVVATSGTALTTEHAKIISRLSDTVYLCFDNDGAGWEATKRAYAILLSTEMSVRVVMIPGGKDPAESISHGSSELFLTAIETARPFFEVYLEKEIAREALTPERLAALLAEALGFIQMIPNKVIQDFSIRALASRLGIKEVVIYDELRRSMKPTFRGGISKASKIPKTSDDSSTTLMGCRPDELLLVAMLSGPERVEPLVLQLTDDDFSPDTIALFRRIREIAELGQPATLRLLTDGLDDSLKAKFDYYALYGEVAYQHLSLEIFEKDVLTALDKVVQNRKNVQLEALKRVIQNFQSEGKKSEMLVALEQLRQKLAH